MIAPRCLALLLASPFAALPAAAHFQEIIPSADVLTEGGEVSLDLVFTHPVEGGPVMAMERPAAVGVLAGGVDTDLSGALEEAPRDGAAAWRLTHTLEEPGAAVFHVTPQPYWEPAEGKFIVHYAKVIVDSYASGEGWDELVGLPVEIMPLTRPTGVWAGNVFTGVVTKNGAPVPFAEVEVEFVNDGAVTPPNDAFITQVIKADANGTFTYAMPFPAWWGFAALVEADTPMTSPEGDSVPVEEGGLIWVKATAAGE
ncbi:ABC cobalt transporter, periplasmic binding protein CbiN [Stappia sp. 22II-S9-Z10]|nr:ABC cobalt transporter, periplasmic binding protein CbiN [Stappia sp. 22II-S9-Z10]